MQKCIEKKEWKTSKEINKWVSELKKNQEIDKKQKLWI